MKSIAFVIALVAAPVIAQAQAQAPAAAPARRYLPASTMISVTPLEEISSKKVEEGQEVAFSVVNDVVENGAVAIQRGAPVKGTITWKTGRAIGGKSGKFEVTFNSVNVLGRVDEFDQA